MRSIYQLILCTSFLITMTSGLMGCNTVRGFGQDIHNVATPDDTVTVQRTHVVHTYY